MAVHQTTAKLKDQLRSFHILHIGKRWLLMAGITVLLAFVIIGYIGVYSENEELQGPGYCEKPSDIMIGYECVEEKCQKSVITTGNKTKCLTSLDVCRLTCGHGSTLWPLPSGDMYISKELTFANNEDIQITCNAPADPESKLVHMVNFLKTYIKDNIQHMNNEDSTSKRGKKFKVALDIKSSQTELKQHTNESYSLIVNTSNNEIHVVINGNTYFGLKHGVETFLQLLVYDNKSGSILVPENVSISNDKPAFEHRGLVLDTSRSYYTVESIKRTLRTMSMYKLNTFHWHITDTQSFPYVSKKYPQMSTVGAYEPHMVYTQKDIKDIVEYARNLAIRVVPELDMPAHVGEGWQIFQDKDGKSYLTCFRAQPWQNYCVEPPCGQLNPSIDGVYDVLKTLFEEYLDLFDSDLFHLGADEVSTVCWDTPEIKNWTATIENTTVENVTSLITWKIFQDRVLELLEQANKNKKNLRPIIWTSMLTEKGELNSEKYVIQIWLDGTDKQIADLLKKGHDLIFSNVDALYLDCGFNNWIKEGNNWCSPYKGWQLQYMNNPFKLVQDLGLDPVVYKKQLLGAEAALWSEQADVSVLDARLWPRVTALAERLWTNPNTTWREAESRLMYQRRRMVSKGIQAELPEPLWCLQHEGQCPLNL